jgi:hypothetical protein
MSSNILKVKINIFKCINFTLVIIILPCFKSLEQSSHVQFGPHSSIAKISIKHTTKPLNVLKSDFIHRNYEHTKLYDS